jgi:hypothetical protein
MGDWLRDAVARRPPDGTQDSIRTGPPPPLRVPGGESAGARSSSMPAQPPTGEDWVRSVLDNRNG